MSVLDTRNLPFDQVIDLLVPLRPAGECWIWNGSIDKHGYGQYNTNGSPKRAHRLVYAHFKGGLDQSKVLRHRCDNPPCVNPDHLIPGSHVQNIQDSIERDRHSRGSRNHFAKLDEATVMEIRTKYATGAFSQALLAFEYGLTATPMSQLLRGITWKHIPVVSKGMAA